MEKHTIDLLEFDKIVDAAAEYASGSASAGLLKTQKILTDYEEWKLLSDAVFAVVKMLQDNILLPGLNLPDLSSINKKIRIEGSVLETAEAADILVYLKSASRLKKHLLSSVNNKLILANTDYNDTADICNTISYYIKDDGSIKEENIKELKNIKTRTAGVNREINKTVGRIINDTAFSSCLQEKSSTVRESRIVFPVKENFRGKIKGVVHGASSTGLTLFIEPFELCELNNELIKLEELYKIEIFKILKKITVAIRDNINSVVDIFNKVNFIDTIIARARFSFSSRCINPEIISKGLDLKNIRHYLLGINCIPVDLIFKDNVSALVISGPNTGGKTVALKTAGLAVLMNQFCLGITADEGSKISIFDNVLADIGDEQSILSSLSTFSAHMKNISEIINKSTGSSLVLLDEPGTGTDPEEGAAITLALFDYLFEKKVLFIATTHQGILKNYAASRKEADNVSVAYNPETYMPEYKIIYGIPGESYGIDIAMKNGIHQEIIEKARKYMGSEKININQLLNEISSRQKMLDEKDLVIIEREKELFKKIRDIDLKELQLRQKENELLKKEKKETGSFLRESRKKIENSIKQIIENKGDPQAVAEVRAAIEELEIREKELAEIVDHNILISDEYHQSDYSLIDGETVYVGMQKVKGTILRKTRKNRYMVSAGSLKMEVDIKDIYYIEKNKTPPRQMEKSVSISKPQVFSFEKPVFELDLRGLRLEDAINRLEKQIDSAIINNLGSFSVIHGLGEGILQKGVSEYLSSCSAVKKNYFAVPENGGFGKTIVELQ